MSEATALAPPPPARARPDSSRGAPRRTGRRQALPSGRAVVGGFLVAVSALGVYLAWSGATQGPTEQFVVAARDLPIGTRLSADDLEVVAMDLPRSLAANAAFDDANDLDGVKVVNPIRKGELVQASALVVAGSQADALEVSFAIEASRAVAGGLKPGEFIDVLATFGAGADTYTTTVLQGSRVLDITESGGALGSTDARVITLAVANADEARAVAHAVNVAKIMLVRSAPSPTKSEQGGMYRAPAAGDRAEQTSG